MADNKTRNDQPLQKMSLRTSVELTIFIYMVASALTGSAITNIMLYKTCVNSLDYTVDECKFFLSPVKTNETSDLEVAVQKHFTRVATVKSIVESIFPVILSIFLGGWSDTYGRKPLLVGTLFGLSVSGILTVIFGSMKSLGPWWSIGTSIPFAITGGYMVLFTGAYCYVSDTSSLKNTAVRIMILDASTSLGSFTGNLLSSYLIAMMGNVYLLLFTATLNVIAYAFTKICIVESLTGALQHLARCCSNFRGAAVAYAIVDYIYQMRLMNKNVILQWIRAHIGLKDNEIADNLAKQACGMNGASQIFDFSYAKEMFKECFKERPNRGRRQIIIIAIVKLLLFMITMEISSLEYLYSRQKLQWYLRDFTTYSAVSTVIGFFGGILGVIVLQRLLQLGDILISAFVLLSSVADNIVKLFAVHSWQMYLGTVISVFKGVIGPLMFSHIIKIIPAEDKAKVLAIIAVTESLALIIGPVIFNSLYSATVAEFPGAIYALAAVLNTTCVGLLILMQYYSRS